MNSSFDLTYVRFLGGTTLEGKISMVVDDPKGYCRIATDTVCTVEHQPGNPIPKFLREESTTKPTAQNPSSSIVMTVKAGSLFYVRKESVLSFA